MRNLFIACTLILAPLTVMASQPEATSCAAKLDANSKLVFDSTIGAIKPGADLKTILTDNTKKLVMDGKLSRGIAKDAATAAANCLKLAAN